MEITITTGISSTTRPIVEGSQEWDVLYRKGVDEELKKQMHIDVHETFHDPKYPNVVSKQTTME